MDSRRTGMKSSRLTRTYRRHFRLVEYNGDLGAVVVQIRAIGHAIGVGAIVGVGIGGVRQVLTVAERQTWRREARLVRPHHARLARRARANRTGTVRVVQAILRAAPHLKHEDSLTLKDKKIQC